MSDQPRHTGRPTTVPVEGEKATLGIRASADLKSRLLASSALSGRSLSAEAEMRLEQSYRDDQSLAEAMTLSYGEINGGLVRLHGEVLRVLAPRGEWLDDGSTRERVVRGIVRLHQRLAAPDDGHISRDNSPEGRVDVLLYELGDDGSAHPGPLLAQQRWAAEIRRHLGPMLRERLIEMHHTVKAARQAMPPQERPPVDPEISRQWGAAFADVQAQFEDDGIKGAIADIRRKIAALADQSPDDQAATRRFLGFMLKALKIDPKTRAELSSLLAQTEPEAGPGSTPAEQ
jgi:hypothetical protein